MNRSLPPRPSLEQLRKQVKELRQASLALTQRSAQAVLARQYGFDSWADLRAHVDFLRTGKVRQVYAGAARKQRDSDDFDTLVAACRRGQIDTVKRILDTSGWLVNRTRWYRPPLYFAVQGGHAHVVRYLLERGANPDHPEDGWVGEKTVEIARVRGYDEIVSLIVAASHHDGLQARDSEGNTPLHRAVALNDRALVDYLLDEGAELDARRDDGFRPVHLALYRDPFWTNRYRDRHDLARHLVARGADYTASIAAALGDLDRVRDILKGDRSLANDPDTLGKRPLSCAAEVDHQPILKLLLERGADPNLPEAMCHGDGYALFAAAVNNNHRCARLLLEHGANPNAVLDSSGSVYSWCRDDRMRQLVLSFGARPNIATHVCAEEVDTVKQLLAQDPSLADEALHVQGVQGPDSEANCIAMYEAAFEHGADPEACASYSLLRALEEMPRVAVFLMDHGVRAEIVLHSVARRGLVEIMEQLIRRGVDLEHREPDYEGTPLTTAARAGQTEMVELLLTHGARPRHPDDPTWSTPEFWAERHGYSKIVELLRSRDQAG